jgi:Na+-transporting methylmalonyl-CoA/oxaloacetate decarboxylase gamma subunit
MLQIPLPFDFNSIFTLFFILFVIAFIIILAVFFGVFAGFVRFFQKASEANSSGEEAALVKERETIREIVKIRCPYCSNLYDEKHDKCPHCGGKREH